MNPFAKPEEAAQYDYTEFPAPERKEQDFSFADNPASRKFIPFDVDQNRIQDETLPTVQNVRLQDFKEVISRVS
jgi:hypothetical protein